MISVHAIRAGAGVADYYLQREGGCEHEHALDRAAYYTGAPDLPGRWAGDGTSALGLIGAFDEAGQGQFRELLQGRLGEERLLRPVLRRDAEGRMRDIRIAAYDVTVSAPKSVSTLMAVASPAIASLIVQAHNVASQQALLLLQQLSARAARGHHGDGQRAPRIATDGFVAAAFDHHTSRALDPQLHTHVVVMNLARGADGRWSALDSRTLHRQATTASYRYQHLLRAQLTEHLGVEWEPIERGVAEMAGVPLGVRREFSTRRRQIEAQLATGRATSKRGRHVKTLAAKAACLATRPAKTRAAVETLREEWVRRAAANGFGPDRVRAFLTEQHTPEPLDRRKVEAHVLGQDGTTRERATFDHGTVLRELISALPPGTNLSGEDLLAWAARLVQNEEVITVENAAFRTYTTAGMLDAEQQLLTVASRVDGPPLALVDRSVAAGALAGWALRTHQRDVAHMLLTSGRPVDVLSGPAGSGKTKGLLAAASVWKTQHIEVRGTALAALTAQGLQDATGAPSVSLARTLQQPHTHVPQGGVLLVDEAGMIGTRQLLRLLTVARQRDCKVVLVGDPAQLPELEAGGSFAALTRLPSALHLDGHGRQINPWEQHALLNLRTGRTTDALDAYDQHERLHVAVTKDELHQQVVADYRTARRDADDPWNVVVLTPRRHDVTQLNELIRTQLRAEGVLGRRAFRVQTAHGARDYRKGDQVLVTRNDYGRDLLNGTHGLVRTVRRDGLVIQLTDGRRLLLDKAWLSRGELEHGYAMTLHKAQGRTVHTSLVISDESLSQEGGYVGLSRGTHANHLYLEAGTEAALRDPCASG